MVDRETTDAFGLRLHLEEVTAGGRYSVSADRRAAHRERAVDTNSRLELTFDPPPPESDLAASPEWKKLEKLSEELQHAADWYLKLCQAAQAASAEDVAGIEAHQKELRAYDQVFRGLMNSLMVGNGGPPLLTSEELNAWGTAQRSGDAWAWLASHINRERVDLETRAKAMTKASAEDLQVVVRVQHRPRQGDPQFLAIPDYYELENSGYASPEWLRSARMARLQAEFNAASQLAGGIREVKAKEAEFREILKRQTALWKEAIEAWVDGLEDRADSLATQLEGVIKKLPADTDLDTPEKQAVAADLKALRKDIKTLRDLIKDMKGLVSMLANGNLPTSIAEAKAIFDAAGDLLGRLKSLKESAGHDQDGWLARAESIVDNAAKILGNTASSEFTKALESLKETVKLQFQAAYSDLQAELPETTKALQLLVNSFNPTSAGVLSGLAELQLPPGLAIPRSFQSLPPAIVSLDDYPIEPGDRLLMTVEFWRAGNLEKSKSDKTLGPETRIRYSMRAVRTGWVWSGDLIFTRAFDGPADDAFTANAGVSREFHWYSRKHPNGTLNALDPAIGFHAAQLNQDADESVEFGVGVNFSLWNGLLRLGAGYNLGAEDDETYYFIGFGLISALNLLNDVGRNEVGSLNH